MLDVILPTVVYTAGIHLFKKLQVNGTGNNLSI